MRRLARLAALTGACLLVLAGVARAETIQVTTTEDLPANAAACPGPNCSLRKAIASSTSGDTIELGGTESSPAFYFVTQGTQLEVNHSLTIVGGGVGATTISGFGNVDPNFTFSRIMRIGNSTDTQVSIEGLTFTGGLDEHDENCALGCATLDANGGGALFNAGAAVSLSHVAFERNGTSTSGQPVGGAIANQGELEMVNVSFREDRAAFGGGLFAHGGTVVGNRVTFESEGGSAFGGGAVFLYRGATVNLQNTTVTGSGSASGLGGGIVNSSGRLVLNNDTLAGNTRGSLETDGSATTAVGNTIIASGNSGGVDFDCVAPGKETNAGTQTNDAISEDLGNNIDQDNACSALMESDQRGVDPKLAPIGDNGGSVRTQALLAGSPALEHGNARTCAPTDARGAKRPEGKVCDVGAFEAILRGAPTADTEPVFGLGMERVTLLGSFDLAGEAGGYHFVYGTSASELTNQTPEVSAGIVNGSASADAFLHELEPSTTYFYALVADNASGSQQGKVLKFKTTSEENPPEITEVGVGQVTENSGEVLFTIDPHGSETEYWVEYGVDSVREHQTERVDIGAEPGPRKLSQIIAGLSPSTIYFFRVVASNFRSDGSVASEEMSFETEEERGPPTVSKTKVVSVGETSATVEATINPNGHKTSYSFGYGLESIFEHETEPVEIGSGIKPVTVKKKIEGLQPESTYRVEAGASASGFDTVFGEQAEFTTEPLGGAPIISGVEVAAVTASTAKLNFAINPNGADTTYVIEYGPNANREEHTTVLDIGSGRKAQKLSAELTGLKAETTYHFEINAKNSFAPEGVHAEDQTFKTVGPPVIGEVKAGAVTETTGKAEFTLDPAGLETTYEVEYGPTATYGKKTAAKKISAQGGVQKLAETIAGLEPNHVYHFRITASNAQAPAGVHSTDHELKTAPGPPVITGVKAGAVTETTGKAEFALDPAGSETTYEVEYGPTAAYGKKTVAKKVAGNTGVQKIAETIAGLEPNHVYHFRVTASNAQAPAGGVHSGDVEFKTAAGPPIIAAVKAGPVTETTGKAEFSIDPDGSETTYEVEYGPTAAYGKKTVAKKIAGNAGVQKIAETMAGLEPNHVYHFRITATNPQAPAGGVHSADVEFKTAPGPPIITEVKAGAVTETTGKAEFALDPQGSETTYEVEYGPTAAYGKKTAAKKVAGNSGVQKIAETIAGLEPNDTYHFRITASNAQAPGGVHSADHELKTAPGPPVITEVKAGAVTETTGKAEFALDPQGSETTYEVEYGPSASYGQKTAAKKVAGNAGLQKIAETIAGLEPNHVYHFRITASNAQAPAGVHSTDHEFKTAPGPPVIGEVKAGAVTETTGAVEFSLDPQGSETTYEVEYGATAAYGQKTAAKKVAGNAGLQHITETIAGLAPHHTYHFRVTASNAQAPAGLHSGDHELTTLAGAPIVTEAKASVTEVEATIHVTIDPRGADTKYVIEYGPNTKRELHTEPIDLGAEAGPQQLEQKLTGLAPNTTYHFEVAATNEKAPAGVRSADQEFTTGSGKPIVTEVNTGPPTDTTATVEFALDPNGADTTYLIEYGTDAKHEQQTEAIEVEAEPGVQHLTQTISGLKPNTTYHYVVVAKNVNAPGGVASEEQEFLTFGAPLVSDVKVTATSETAATITFTIEPAGLQTSYVIQYGPTSQYGQETTPESVGAGHEPVQVTRTLTGLEAGHTYHFAILASNQDAVTGERSPDTPFTTVAPKGGKPGSKEVRGTKEKLLPPPVLGKTFNVEPVSGKVYVELPLGAKASSFGLAGDALLPIKKGRRFIPLTEARQLPFGSVLEATAGVAKITTATSVSSKFQVGDFGAGIFKLLQSRKQRGLTQLNIIDNRSRKVCATVGKKKATAAKLSSKVLGRLRGNAHGKYVTRGQYSSATVRGTIWSVTNQCNGTLTRVTRHTVLVRDFRLRKTIAVHSGHTYLARAPH